MRKTAILALIALALGYWGFHATKPQGNAFKPVSAYHDQLRGI